jgi:hypothetical protein
MGKKLFIGLLILFAVLYVGSLVFGVATLESGKEREHERQDLLSFNDTPFAGVLDTLSGLFAPPLVLSEKVEMNSLAGKLERKCSGQSVDAPILLTEAAPICELSVRTGKGEDFGRAELKADPASVPMRWVVNGGQPEGCLTAGAADAPSAVRLVVEYTPADPEQKQEAKKQDPACQLQDPKRPATLTATRKSRDSTLAGDIKLTCVGCDERAGRSIQLEFQ